MHCVSDQTLNTRLAVVYHKQIYSIAPLLADRTAIIRAAEAEQTTGISLEDKKLCCAYSYGVSEYSVTACCKQLLLGEYSILLAQHHHH